MKTFFGTITSCDEIRLENGLTIKHNTDGFKLGSKVLISFDMCKNRVRKIWRKEEITPNDTEHEPEPETPNYRSDPELDDECNRLITILESMEMLSQTEL
jgi:hypothetical protein